MKAKMMMAYKENLTENRLVNDYLAYHIVTCTFQLQLPSDYCSFIILLNFL